MEKQTTELIEQLKHSSFFEVHNGQSAFSQYYHMDAPFSAVIETYRANEEEEYFKIVNFAPDEITHYLIHERDMLSYLQHRSLHQHDFFEFMFVLEGEVTVRIEDTERIYPAGTGCLVNCNLRHAEKFSQSFRVFFLNLSKRYVTEVFPPSASFYFNAEKNRKNAPICDFLSANSAHDTEIEKEYLDFFPLYQNHASYQAVYDLAEQIFHTMLFPTFGATYRINSLICRLFAIFSDAAYFHTTKIRLDFGVDFLLFTRVTHLFEDSDGHLQRRELAELLHYSGDYLNRIVKKYTGMSIFDYGMTFCMRRAEQLLCATDYPVSKIAAMLGFSNRTHFYRVFSAKHGMTPREYRIKKRS